MVAPWVLSHASAVVGRGEAGRGSAINPTVLSTEAGPNVIRAVRGWCRKPSQSLAGLPADMQLQARI